jgi:tetratricopeptide (TPR) repeat protein
VAAYQRALELRPGLALVHSNLGQAYAVQGHLEEAIREWETLLRLDPDHPQAVGWIRRARQKTAER